MATKTHSGQPRQKVSGRPAPRQPGTKKITVKGGSGRPGWWLPTAVAVAVLAVLFAVFHASSHPRSATASYQVGSPGIGMSAPAFTLPSTAGHPISLADYRGKTVLLYFQEGVGCEPCWTQMKDLEKMLPQVHAAGIDEMVSITTQPVDVLSQKARDESVSMSVLSDPSLSASHAYTANAYGMMGMSMDGHTFVLVGPDGTIQWRGDYGGAPNYTMYVAPTQLLSQIAAGRHR